MGTSGLVAENLANLIENGATTGLAQTAATADARTKSGEVKSVDTYTYGKFIARIQGDNKLGTNTSFFTFWDGSAAEPWSVQNWSEIDGVELVPSAAQGPLSTNIIWQGQQQNHQYITSADPKDEWHIYEFQWTPDYISFLYDGQEVKRVAKGSDHPEVAYMTRPQHIMMNFWVPDSTVLDWHDGYTPADFPWYARYDYVEYWEYVPPAQWASTDGADVHHPFKKTWKDDFDAFDNSRWNKSNNWSFTGNETDFMAD